MKLLLSKNISNFNYSWNIPYPEPKCEISFLTKTEALQSGPLPYVLRTFLDHEIQTWY